MQSTTLETSMLGCPVRKRRWRNCLSEQGLGPSTPANRIMAPSGPRPRAKNAASAGRSASVKGCG
eukprot:10628720-Alexandrium_andersonii.AAC.1